MAAIVTREEALALMTNLLFDEEKAKRWLQFYVDTGMFRPKKRTSKDADPYFVLEDNGLPAATIIQTLSSAGFRIVEK